MHTGSPGALNVEICAQNIAPNNHTCLGAGDKSLMGLEQKDGRKKPIGNCHIIRSHNFTLSEIKQFLENFILEFSDAAL